MLAQRQNKAKAELINNLPEEIVLDILSRLPIKSLVRFMCVSNQWHSLIEDYVKNVRPRQKKVMILSTNDSFSLHSVDEEACVERVRRQWKKKKTSPDSGYYRHYAGISNSCNGLFLVMIDDDLFLWNPLTKYSKKVLSHERLQNEYYSVVCGLCHDTSNNEYKAVLALSHESPDYGGEFVMVGCFRRKSWTRVHFPYNIRQVQSGPIVNEHLHWLTRQSLRFLSPHRIVSFDPRNNEFKKVPMPLPKDGDNDIILGLAVLEKCLCMVRLDKPRNHGSNSVEVLAMKQYGIEKSWTIMFIILNLPTLHSYDDLVLLCSTKNGEIMLKINKDLWAYNPEDKSRRRVAILTPIECWYMEAMVYEENLVTPPDYNWEGKEKRGEATSICGTFSQKMER